MSESHHDEFPVKDITEAHRTKSLVMDKDRVLRRDEYQDRIHQLTDENVFLKKHVRKFEEKSKHLEAKLSRILSEKKNIGRKDEFQAEENKCRILELEYQVGMLKDRLIVAKQQLVSMQSIHPKTKTRQNKLASSTSNPGVGTTNYELTEQVEILLLEAKAENQALDHQLHIVRDQMLSTQRELETTKELLQLKEIAHEDELAVLRAHPPECEHKKQKLADNIQLIRLQRDSRRASSWLSTLQTQCKTLEASLSSAQENGQQLEAQLQAAQEELRDCQQLNLNLQKQVDDGVAELNHVKELEAQLQSLQNENVILKEANEALQSKAANAAEKARKVENQEENLKSQLSQIEISLKKEIQSKTELYSDVTREKTRCSELTETLNELKTKFSLMEAEVKRLELIEKSLATVKDEPSTSSSQDLKKDGELLPATTTNSQVTSSLENGAPAKTTTTTKTTTVVVSEKDETKGQQQQQQQQQVEQQDDTKTEKTVSSCEYCKTLEKDLAETRGTIGRLYDDFIKTKNLLRGQIATNRECHKEIEVLSSKLEKADRFHHDKLQEFMKLLEERAAQMLTLEKNLEVIKSQSSLINNNKPPPVHLVDSCIQVDENEVKSKKEMKSSNTHQHPPATTTVVEDSTKETPSVEIFIDKFLPAKHRTHLVNENLFATWEFDDNGTQYTPIVRNGIFNARSKKKINTESFQHQIEVQIHQAIGPSDCQTLGKGILSPDSDTCVLQSVATVPEEPIGQLKYKFVVRGVELNASQLKKLSSSSSAPPPSSSSVHRSQPFLIVPQQQQQQQQQHQLPVPKPRKSPIEVEVESSSSYFQEASDSSNQSDASRTSQRSQKKTKKIEMIKQVLEKPLSHNNNNNNGRKSSKQSRDSTNPVVVVEGEGGGSSNNNDGENKSLPSPKKPILRRESASPEIKKKMLKKVTVTEIVEERRIPSSEEEKYVERTSIRQKRVRQQQQQQKQDIESSSSSEVSGDGSTEAASVLMVQSKEGTDQNVVVVPDNNNKQVPIITVQSIDSREEDVGLVGAGAAKNFPTDSTTELEQSSGSGDEKPYVGSGVVTVVAAGGVNKQESSTRPKTRRKPRKTGTSKEKDVLIQSGTTTDPTSIENSYESSSSSPDSDVLRQTVRIEIEYIVFNTRCRIWTDPKVKRFYVEYRFLNYKPEELETPNSLPKPQPGKKAHFNFVKVFVIDSIEKRKALQQSVQEKKRIRFTLVSEPGEDDTLDCEDIGYAYVPMNILEKEDLVQEELIIFDAENPKNEIGKMCVSIQASDVIKTL